MWGNMYPPMSLRDQIREMEETVEWLKDKEKKKAPEAWWKYKFTIFETGNLLLFASLITAVPVTLLIVHGLNSLKHAL